MGLPTNLSGATSLDDDTIGFLDAQFRKPLRNKYTRGQVLSCKQRDDECITEFLQQLRNSVERCEFTDLTVQQHKDIFPSETHSRRKHRCRHKKKSSTL